jgi:hypothetical protein
MGRGTVGLFLVQDRSEPFIGRMGRLVGHNGFGIWSE